MGSYGLKNSTHRLLSSGFPHLPAVDSREHPAGACLVGRSRRTARKKLLLVLPAAHTGHQGWRSLAAMEQPAGSRCSRTFCSHLDPRDCIVRRFRGAGKHLHTTEVPIKGRLGRTSGDALSGPQLAAGAWHSLEGARAALLRRSPRSEIVSGPKANLTELCPLKAKRRDKCTVRRRSRSASALICAWLD